VALHVYLVQRQNELILHVHGQMRLDADDNWHWSTKEVVPLPAGVVLRLQLSELRRLFRDVEAEIDSTSFRQMAAAVAYK
jgi:hypothetical protein